MDISHQIVSDITVYSKYSKYIPKLKRRETWEEVVQRNLNMHKKKYPKLKKEIDENYKLVFEKKVLPSMRGLQFAGKPIEISPSRQYNCGFMHMDHPDTFSELMFLLLGGSGIGYSVQTHHIAKLPAILKPIKTRRYLISDSIEGWADSIKVLIKSYIGSRSSLPLFDFSDVRAKGEPLKTTGGIAPGPEPLKTCLHQITKILDRKENGSKLTSLEVHDINCYIADAVLSGGIRRSAMIALFSFRDQDMLTCKFGNWSEENPQRGRANNSVVILRHKIKEEEFFALWEKIQASGSGEPGFCFTNDQEWGFNPCVEIGLRTNQFCNTSIVNVSDIVDQKDFNRRAKAAAFIGTLQAGYTDFHYLRDVWKENTEKEYLIGVSMNGIASGVVLELDQKEAAEIVKKENERVAALIGISPAARCTTVKPEGTSSLVLGCSPGIHAWHCLQRQSKILMADGRWEEVGKLVRSKSTEKVVTYDENRECFISKPIEGWHKNKFPTADWRKIITKYHTASAVFTSEHRVLTSGGWREVRNLSDKDKIASGEYSFSDVEKQVVLGSILGDGCLDKINLCRMVYGHCKEQKEYLDWKSSLISRLKPRVISINKEEFIQMSTKSSKILAELYDRIYVNNQRTIKAEWIKELSELGIAVWYMDDGGLCVEGGYKNIKENNWCMRIATQSFDIGQVNILINHLKEKYNIYPDVFNNRGVALRFKKKEALKFFDIICKYIPDSMQHKLPLQFRNKFVSLVLDIPKKIYYEPIIRQEKANVSRISGSYKTAYCIDVKDTHNFITKSGVTHNSKYYIRRMRFNKDEPIYSYFMDNHPMLMEDDFFKPHLEAILSVPQKAPDNAVTKSETALQLLSRVKKVYTNWIKSGHRTGHNTNNVSCTVNLKDNEWSRVGKWMWENRNNYTALAVFPHDMGSYKQTPFEEIDEKQYKKLMKGLKGIDLTKVVENGDFTKRKDIVACGGGNCEIV